MDFNTIRARILSIGSDILNVTLDAVTGAMVAQTGDSVNGTVDSNNAEIWQQPGFASIPSPAAPGASGAQRVAVKNGDRDVIIAQRDTRAGNAIGNMVPGEAMMFATGANGSGSAKCYADADGNVTLATTDTGSVGGNVVYLQVSPTALHFVAPWGTLVFDATGFHVACDNGPSFDMTCLSGLPGPLASFSSAITMQCSVYNPQAATVLLGQPGPLGYQSCLYTPTATGAALPPGTPVTTIGAAAAVTCLSPSMVSSAVFVGS